MKWKPWGGKQRLTSIGVLWGGCSGSLKKGSSLPQPRFSLLNSLTQRTSPSSQHSPAPGLLGDLQSRELLLRSIFLPCLRHNYKFT